MENLLPKIAEKGMECALSIVDGLGKDRKAFMDDIYQMLPYWMASGVQDRGGHSDSVVMRMGEAGDSVRLFLSNLAAETGKTEEEILMPHIMFRMNQMLVAGPHFIASTEVGHYYNAAYEQAKKRIEARYIEVVEAALAA